MTSPLLPFPTRENFLTEPFNYEEVKEAVMDMKRDTAPGPNEFGISFFQHFSELVKEDLMNMFRDFHGGSLDITVQTIE